MKNLKGKNEQTFRKNGRSFFKSYDFLVPKLIFLIFIGLSTLFLYYSGIGCVWRHFLDISCLGCGMTRAYISLLKGNISAAFGYHPMFWSVPILFYYFIFTKKLLAKKIHIIILTLIAIGFIVNWLAKIPFLL